MKVNDIVLLPHGSQFKISRIVETKSGYPKLYGYQLQKKGGKRTYSKIEREIYNYGLVVITNKDFWWT